MLIKFYKILNYIFDILHSLDGFLHWMVQRSTVFLVLFFVPVMIFLDSVYLFFLIAVLLTFHISAGLRTLVDDYVHDGLLFLLGNTLLRILLIFSLKAIFVLFVC